MLFLTFVQRLSVFLLDTGGSSHSIFIVNIWEEEERERTGRLRDALCLVVVVGFYTGAQETTEMRSTGFMSLLVEPKAVTLSGVQGLGSCAWA